MRTTNTVGAWRRRGTAVLALSSAACSLLTNVDGLLSSNTSADARDAEPDSTTVDGGEPSDAGALDAGALDAGALDAGPLDAGPLDAPSALDAPARAYADEIHADSPLTYLRFNETTGSLAADEAIPGPSVSITGTFAWNVPGPAPLNAALSLTGATLDYGTRADFDFAGTAPYTLEVWIKTRVVDATYRHLFTKAYVASTGREEYGLFVQGSGIAFDRYVQGTQQKAGTSVGLVGRWAHVVATYDGTMALYIDGVLAASVGDSRAQASKPVSLLIGGRTASTGLFDGDIDELAIYDKALSAARIKAHFDAMK